MVFRIYNQMRGFFFLRNTQIQKYKSQYLWDGTLGIYLAKYYEWIKINLENNLNYMQVKIYRTFLHISCRILHNI